MVAAECCEEDGEVWLVFSSKEGLLYRVAGEALESFPLSELTEPYIDNYATSNRLQVHRHSTDDPPPAQRDMTDDEFQRATRAYNCGGTTIILGYCTNAVRLRLLATTGLSLLTPHRQQRTPLTGCPLFFGGDEGSLNPAEPRAYMRSVSASS